MTLVVQFESPKVFANTITIPIGETGHVDLEPDCGHNRRVVTFGRISIGEKLGQMDLVVKLARANLGSR